MQFLHTQRHGSGNNCCPDTMNSCASHSSQDIGLAQWTQSQAWYNAWNRMWNSRSVKYITQQLARDWLQVCSYVCLAPHHTPCTSEYFVDHTAAAGPQLSSVCTQIRGASRDGGCWSLVAGWSAVLARITCSYECVVIRIQCYDLSDSAPATQVH